MLGLASSLFQILNWFVRNSCDLESLFVSVERIKELSENDQEQNLTKDEIKFSTERGKIEFRNFSTRYRFEMTTLKWVWCLLELVIVIGFVGRSWSQSLEG